MFKTEKSKNNIFIPGTGYFFPTNSNNYNRIPIFIDFRDKNFHEIKSRAYTAPNPLRTSSAGPCPGTVAIINVADLYPCTLKVKATSTNSTSYKYCCYSWIFKKDGTVDDSFQPWGMLSSSRALTSEHVCSADETLVRIYAFLEDADSYFTFSVALDY